MTFQDDHSVLDDDDTTEKIRRNSESCAAYRSGNQEEWCHASRWQISRITFEQIKTIRSCRTISSSLTWEAASTFSTLEKGPDPFRATSSLQAQAIQ